MRACNRSVPCVRAVATSRASPVLASQAENARRKTGMEEKFVELNCMVHRDRAMNRDNIIPSRQRRADNKWVRWNVRPANPRMKAEEKEKWTGVIRWLWILTIGF